MEQSSQIDLNSIKLPYILKNKVLMTPGIWNGDFYDAAELHRGFKNTDWNDPDNTVLVLDHKNDEVGTVVGKVTNPRMLGEKLIGDLEIVDMDTAIKHAYGLKMGISPRVLGKYGSGNAIQDMKYNNFAIVFSPAQGKLTHLQAAINAEIPYVTLELQEAKMEKKLNMDMNSCVMMITQAGYPQDVANAMCQAAQGMMQPVQPGGNPMDQQMNDKIESFKTETSKALSEVTDAVKQLAQNMQKNDAAFIGRTAVPKGDDSVADKPVAKQLHEMTAKEIRELKHKSPNAEIFANRIKPAIRELMKETDKDSRHQLYFNHLKGRRSNPSNGRDAE